MNNDLDWQKVLEWPQNETTYLIHIITDQQQISIQVEDKYSGDIWQSLFSSNGIQQLTNKARNPKKYTVFTKMLISALMKTSDSISVEILSYRQMNNKFGKPGAHAKSITPEQASKRFLLLTYIGQFQKMQFPLPLMHCSDVNSDRLKLTIKRLSQQLNLLKQGQSQDQILKENSLLKYENQSLKTKLKSSHKLDSSSVYHHPKTQELERQLNEKTTTIVQLQGKLAQAERMNKQSQRKLKESQEKVNQLETMLQNMESHQSDKLKTKKKMDSYEKKIEEMINQMEQLSGELNYSREKEKKSQLKINTLQKQLEQMMMSNKKVKPRNTVQNYRDSSPEDKRSEKSFSVKSGKSNNSQKSLSKTRNLNRKNFNTFGQPLHFNNSNSKRLQSGRKSSVMDSDTESSRMRRMANNRSSPYRQSAAVSNKNKNPVNINNKKVTTNQRSRSRSKQRTTTPRQPVVFESHMMTDGYQSDSSQEDSEFNQIDSYLKTLKQKKGARNTVKQKNTNHQSGSRIQNRLETLEEMIKKTAQATKLKH